MGSRGFGWSLVVAGVAAITLAIPAAAVSAQHGRGDQAAFDRLRGQQEQAWIDEDGQAFADTFTENGDVVTFNGDHLRTRAGIAKGMQHYFDKYIDGSRLHLLTEHVRYLNAGTVVIVRTGCLLQGEETACRPDSQSTNTNLLVKQRGRWSQESFQNTRAFALP